MRNRNPFLAHASLSSGRVASLLANFVLDGSPQSVGWKSTKDPATIYDNDLSKVSFSLVAMDERQRAHPCRVCSGRLPRGALQAIEGIPGVAPKPGPKPGHDPGPTNIFKPIAASLSIRY